MKQKRRISPKEKKQAHVRIEPPKTIKQGRNANFPTSFPIIHTCMHTHAHPHPHPPTHPPTHTHNTHNTHTQHTHTCKHRHEHMQAHATHAHTKHTLDTHKHALTFSMHTYCLYANPHNQNSLPLAHITYITQLKPSQLVSITYYPTNLLQLHTKKISQ